jgi:glutamate N-acetyltransferase / amino-acid N-acetyltransferase
MAVGLASPGRLYPVKGITLAGTHCGIKKDDSILDLVLIAIDPGAAVSAVFTRNRFCAAPVSVAKHHLASKVPVRYLLINSGNANAGTGKSGYQHSVDSCEALAKLDGGESEAVLPFSTGVIAIELPVSKIISSLPDLHKNLSPDHWLVAAKGIMTTDTVAKAVSTQVVIGGKPVTITGISKGSGMICPDMATMLAYIATDAVIEQSELDYLLPNLMQGSFNAITVDGDTSTNDSCVLIATGQSGVSVSDNETFLQALQSVCQTLAQAVIRDAEGATKFIEIKVKNAKSVDDARCVGYTVAHSPLVKTALFASDPNWGRILAAVGRAPIESLDIDTINLWLGDTQLIDQGLPAASYTEEKGQIEMNRTEILITVDLGTGDDEASIWTSDLSYDYVKINAEYRS